MTEERGGYHALLCDDCRVEIFYDVNMVMLRDNLWEEISDKTEDSYCHDCIERRMGRAIEIKDFREITGFDITGTGLVPCNAFWLKENRP